MRSRAGDLDADVIRDHYAVLWGYLLGLRDARFQDVPALGCCVEVGCALGLLLQEAREYTVRIYSPYSRVPIRFGLPHGRHLLDTLLAFGSAAHRTATGVKPNFFMAAVSVCRAFQ